MLDDGDRRAFEPAGEVVGQVPRRVGVEDVEVAEGDAGVLLGPVPDAGGAALAVAGALLVGVLAVAQGLLVALEGDVERRRQRGRLGIGGVEPRHDGGVVGGGVGEGLPGEAAAGGLAERAGRAHLVEDRRVVGRVDDDADVGVVLRRRPHHRRSADVDEVDAVGELAAPGVAGGVGVAEGVQVGHDEGERLDLVGLEVGLVLGVGGVGEDPAVDLRVEGGHPVAEDRRVAGDLLGAGHGDPGLGDGRRRAPAGDERPAGVDEAAGEVDHAGLVVDGQEGPHAVSSTGARGAGSSSDGSASTARMVSG